MHSLPRLLALVIPGAVGLAAMEVVRRSSQRLVTKRAPGRTPPGARYHADESATTAIGRIAYETLFGRPPSEKMKNALSWAVHITYGVGVGAVFAALRPQPRMLDGALYGAALWLLGDELAVPLLGLSDKPSAYHPSQHAQSFAQHLGYGIALAAATRLLVGERHAHACSCGCSS